MNIQHLSIGGFKNLKYTEFDLDKIVAVVSPNNYGKSNLLEALSFATDFISASSKSRKNMMAWSKGIPLSKSLANSDFRFEMEFEDESLGEYSHVRYGFSFSWYRDDKTGQKITNEWIEMHSSENARYSSFLKRNAGKYRKGNSTTAWRNLVFDDSQLAIDVLSSVSELEYNLVIQAIKKFEYRVCSSLELKNRFQASPIEVANVTSEGIAFDDEDVPRALYFLKKEKADKFNLFKEAVFELFPDFYDIDVQAYELKTESRKIQMIISDGDEQAKIEPDDIPFRVRDEMYSLVIYSNTLNQPLNISLMSTGTRRIFWLLANVFIASCTSVSCIGIEELESSIHPKLLKNLLEVLQETLGDTKLIISSHSPYLIQYLKTDHIFVGMPTNDGVAHFKKIAKGKMRALLASAHNFGMSVGEYLFELMSGDEDTLATLCNYLGGTNDEV